MLATSERILSPNNILINHVAIHFRCKNVFLAEFLLQELFVLVHILIGVVVGCITDSVHFVICFVGFKIQLNNVYGLFLISRKFAIEHLSKYRNGKRGFIPFNHFVNLCLLIGKLFVQFGMTGIALFDNLLGLVPILGFYLYPSSDCRVLATDEVAQMDGILCVF